MPLVPLPLRLQYVSLFITPKKQKQKLNSKQHPPTLSKLSAIFVSFPLAFSAQNKERNFQRMCVCLCVCWIVTLNGSLCALKFV